MANRSRGRLDELLRSHQHDDDDSEEGATVLMDGASELIDTLLGGEEGEEEEEAETVVMGSAEAMALLDDEDAGVLADEDEDQTFAPWVEEQDTRMDHTAKRPTNPLDPEARWPEHAWLDPGASEAETQMIREDTPPIVDPVSTLGDGDESAWERPLLGIGVVVALIVSGVLIAAVLAGVALLLM